MHAFVTGATDESVPLTMRFAFSTLPLLSVAVHTLVPPVCNAPTGCYCNDPLAINFEPGVSSPSGTSVHLLCYTALLYCFASSAPPT